MNSKRSRMQAEAELDITSFMNLMIVLVPVLLLSLVFAQIRVLQIQLPPDLAEQILQQHEEVQRLELEMHADRMQLNYPAGEPLRQFAHLADGQPDFVSLAAFLKDLKLTWQQRDMDKRDISILAAEQVDYQTLITAMDTVRSFKAVVAASLVDAELFPLISLGQLPPDAAEVP
ncbi:biopolymer transporter ExbD [Arsukibacterium sp.]|uniref:biopolymer transporter ExbD n=1 Tax=Arsukibacterium sp. TaxID=1977258 RepID=UPI002FDAF009